MIQDEEIGQLMQSIAEKSLHMLQNGQNKPQLITEQLKQYLEISQDYQKLITALINNPDKVFAMQMAYWQDAYSLMQTQFQSWLEGKQLPISSDKRFSSEEWLNNPLFNMMSQHYLLASEHINSLLENMDYSDPKLAKKVQFFTRQILDALSPANYLHTNPQLMAETLQSSGKNLLRGLNNLLTDMESGSARLMIKMTDTSAFTIGKNLAITPGKVIFRNDLIELIQYTPQTDIVKSIPLLIIPPWINKYYIMDLSAQNSLVDWLSKQGITVFIISWVNPDARYAKKGFYDYLHEGPEAAIAAIQEQLGVKQVNALGFCIGGTLLASLLAYHAAKGIQLVKSATFLAAMIDFCDPGDIAVYIDEQQIMALEKEMHAKGFLDGKFMAASFNSLRANDLIWSFFIKNYLQGKHPVPFDILFWNADSTNMPALMHSQYLRWMYLHNELVKPGKITLNHTPLDVTQIKIPTCFISTEKDHIAPWQTTYLGFQLMRGPKQFILGGSGHIAGIINPPGNKKYGYYTNKAAPPAAEDWLASAEKHEDSWWSEWLKWLNEQSGKSIKARSWSELPLAGLMDAPGQYVFNQTPPDLQSEKPSGSKKRSRSSRKTV